MKKIILVLCLIIISLNANSFKDNLIDHLRDKSDMYKINKVNTEINLFKYIPDESDKWSTLDHFLEKRGGDCEDYAIAKATLLKETNFNGKIAFGLSKDQKHIVLLVELNKRIYILDNRSRLPIKFNNEYTVLNYDKLLSIKGV